ncbi:MAG: acyl-CoA dehydrogenase, partial [Actinobacteria bacterium]|nr:acyl-CoA dehydrogenase [Actinomycetota bacterium]
MDFEWSPDQIALREKAAAVAAAGVAKYGRDTASWMNGYSKE